MHSTKQLLPCGGGGGGGGAGQQHVVSRQHQHHHQTAAIVSAQRRRQERHRGVAASSAAAANSSSSSAPEQQQQLAYPYNSGDGRSQKAVLEHIFKPAATSATCSLDEADRVQAPWAVGFQMSERNLVWNDDLKLRLIKRVASQELAISEAELEERLQAVCNLLPDLADRLFMAPPKRIAALASNTRVIAARLLRLREIFPKANASALVSGRLTLLLDEDLEELAAAADRLRGLLPHLCVDRFVEAFPQALDVHDFEVALQDAARLMPQLDITATLRSNPDLVLQFMKGKALIPYDPAWPPTPEQQQQQQQDEEEAAGAP